MKEFKKAIKYVLIYQFICWSIFIICDENKLMSQSSAESLASNIGIILSIIILILYFMFNKKQIKKYNLKDMKFNIFLFILWIITSAIISYGLILLTNYGLLHVCRKIDGWPGCFLNGIEYGIQGILMITTATVILIIKLTIMLHEHLKKKRES